MWGSSAHFEFRLGHPLPLGACNLAGFFLFAAHREAQIGGLYERWWRGDPGLSPLGRACPMRHHTEGLSDGPLLLLDGTAVITLLTSWSN